MARKLDLAGSRRRLTARLDRGNRLLFALYRHQGQYLFNPQLSLRIEGDWRRIYERLQPQRRASQLRDPIRWGTMFGTRTKRRNGA